MTSGHPWLQAVHFSAGYQYPVFSPVDFSVYPENILGISGPNGSGKSTLLNALVGNARRFSGTIKRAAEIELTLQTQKQPELSGIPLSAAELLHLTGALVHQDKLPEPLQKKCHCRLDQLSGGERQFLHLWACLYATGNIALLDEPTNNLDPAGITALTNAIRQRAHAGHAIIIVSHDMDFMQALCTHTLSLEKTK